MEYWNDTLWSKIRMKGAHIDCLYGYRDGTNNHGHYVQSGAEVICDRRLIGISGAYLIPNVTGLPIELYS